MKGRVIGIDVSSKILNHARRKVEALGIKNVEFQEADAEALVFPENSIDVVLCCSALPILLISLLPCVCGAVASSPVDLLVCAFLQIALLLPAFRQRRL